MSPITNLAIFFVIWWLVLFTVLPFGVRGQWEDGTAPKGTEPGAPVKSRILRKFLITTGITILVFIAFQLALGAGVFDHLIGL